MKTKKRRIGQCARLRSSSPPQYNKLTTFIWLIRTWFFSYYQRYTQLNVIFGALKCLDLACIADNSLNILKLNAQVYLPLSFGRNKTIRINSERMKKYMQNWFKQMEFSVKYILKKFKANSCWRILDHLLSKF